MYIVVDRIEADSPSCTIWETGPDTSICTGSELIHQPYTAPHFIQSALVPSILPLETFHIVIDETVV